MGFTGMSSEHTPLLVGCGVPKVYIKDNSAIPLDIDIRCKWFRFLSRMGDFLYQTRSKPFDFCYDRVSIQCDQTLVFSTLLLRVSNTKMWAILICVTFPTGMLENPPRTRKERGSLSVGSQTPPYLS